MPRGNAVSPGLTVLAQSLDEIDGVQVLNGLRSALAYLHANQEQVNDLNVFPVPDGDTGSNMYLTLCSAVEEAQRAADAQSAGAILAAVAHGSLMGARGNSGVILSQILRGLAESVGQESRIDARALADALVEAASVAYRAVMKPTEGTILTVVREASQAARAAARETDDIRVVLDRSVGEAHAAVERTTGQLAVLREAGVVDAGGFGLAIILDGFAVALTKMGSEEALALLGRQAGEPVVRTPGEPIEMDEFLTPRRGAASVAEREEGWGYCTEFLIHGPGLDVDELRKVLAPLGESTLIVGDADLVRIHIHTADPATLITMAASRGRLSKLKVEDMTAQHHEVLERAEATQALPVSEAHPRNSLAVVPVAPGSGFHEIFTGLGAAAIVEGGQTMNPSIENILNAVRAANADSVILLPNNGNVILTAQHVNDIADDIDVVVVPTRNIPQGISALLALDPTASASENAKRMRVAVHAVTCVEVTRAVRDSSINGFDIKSGDVMALVDGEIAQVGSGYQEVIEAVLANVETMPELVTLYRGAGTDEAEAGDLVSALAARFPGVELELHVGGQDHYPYVLSLE